MRRNIAVMAVIGLITLAGVAAWYFINPSESYPGTTDPIVLGGLVSDANTMVFTAEDQHFFEANGINLTFRTYESGLATVDALLDGRVDIADAAEYPVVAKAFQKDNTSIIACTSKSDIVYLVGRIDRGIRNISDLKGKMIGIPRGTITEFYLGRLLDLHGMSIRDITLINLQAGQANDAIANGSIDGVVTWEPYVSKIHEQHANGTVIWSVQSSQAVYSVLVCRNEWIKEHPDLVRKVLNSLAESERCIVQHPDEAKAILQRRYHYSDEYMARAWPEHQFSLSLDQSLITAMEDEGRWMIDNNLTSEKTIPDFRGHIYTKGLEKVKPESVNIIG